MKAKRKRSHKNTKRQTAKERARYVYDLIAHDISEAAEGVALIERALQAHARQALARERLRRK